MLARIQLIALNVFYPMNQPKPLKGLDLVDCARSSATQGLTAAAQQCGYGSDTDGFMAALKAACEEMGLHHIQSLDDLVTEQQRVQSAGGLEIAPETGGEL